MQVTQQGVAQQRHVSLRLAAGIVLLPVVFAWFLLRRGHTTVSRVLGFGWAATVLLAMTMPADVPEDTTDGTIVSPPRLKQEVVAGPVSGDDPGKTSYRAQLSDAAKQLKTLYGQLEQFRHDPQFLRVGFGQCCRYYHWKESVEALDQSSGPAIYSEREVLPRELLQLGQEYVRSRGNSTELSKSIAARLDYALAPATAQGKGGRASSEDWWCRDIEVTFASLRALEKGDFARSEALRDETSCPHVLANTTTGPELARRFYKFSDGGSVGFVKVRLAGGPEVWAPLEEIEFR